MYGFPNSGTLNAGFYVPMNPQTGAFLNQGTGLPVAAFPATGMVTVNSQFLYVSTGGYGPNPAGSIYGYSLDPNTGALTMIQGSPFIVGSPLAIRGMATPPNSHFFYASDAAGIDGFTVDSTTGVPAPISGSPFASGTNVQLVVDPSGTFLYASDIDNPGGVLAYTIGTNGALTPVQGSPFPIPGQTGATSLPVGIVDNGSFVYVALSGTNQVAAYSVNTSTGVLTAVTGSPFAAGNGPSFLTFANKFLYTNNTIDGTISGYSINTTTGALTPVPDSPFNFYGESLADDASGKYLYAEFWGFVHYMSIDPTSGTLTDAGTLQIGFAEPYLITVVQFPVASSKSIASPTP